MTFQVAGHASSTVSLSGSSASYPMPTDLRAGRTYQVTARYNGAKCFRPSSDTASVHVNTQVGGGAPGVSAHPAPPARGLPGVGASEGMLLYGAGGLVLIGAGGVVLGLNRRRSNA